MVLMYSAPSRYGFKNRSTINWKSAIEVEATINLNALKIVGANCASSKIDLPWNLMDKLGVIVCALFDLRDLTRTANREAQLDSCWLGPWFEMAFVNQTSTKNRCGVLWCNCLDPTINWKVNGILLLILSRRKVLNGLFETAFDFQSTDATTNWMWKKACRRRMKHCCSRRMQQPTEM